MIRNNYFDRSIATKAVSWIIGLVLVSGCGPLMVPAMRRLEPDEQAQVNRMWNNMLATPARLDRELLLDVLIVFQLHESGVDKANYHSEKEFSGGVVSMDMTFDRRRPLEDRFTVEIFDAHKQSLRRETYSGEEIWSHVGSLTGQTFHEGRMEPTPSAAPTTTASTQSTDADLRAQYIDIRMKQITAATQPVK